MTSSDRVAGATERGIVGQALELVIILAVLVIPYEGAMLMIVGALFVLSSPVFAFSINLLGLALFAVGMGLAGLSYPNFGLMERFDIGEWEEDRQADLTEFDTDV